MNLQYFFCTLLLLVACYSTIEFENCESSEQPNVKITYINYSPQNSIQIGSTFTFDLGYSVESMTLKEGTLLNITVWYKDFLSKPLFSTTIDLCEDTSVTCPIQVGDHKFTSKALEIPYVPIGKYKIVLNILSETKEEGCTEFMLNVIDKSNPPQRDCNYESIIDLAPRPSLIAHFSTKNVDFRSVGDWLQIGDLGEYGAYKRGQFTNMHASMDVTFGEPLIGNGYAWCLNATITNMTSIVNGSIIVYEGDYWIGNKEKNLNTWDQFLMRGNIRINGTWDTRTNEMIAANGEINAIPSIHYPENWLGPVSFGRFNPIPFVYKYFEDIIVIKKSENICQCKVDVCGVCGGNGSSCAPTPSPSPSPSPSKKAKKEIKLKTLIIAIAVPVGGIIVLILLAVLIKHSKKSNNEESQRILQHNSSLKWENYNSQNN
ncbi:niemann pick type c2 protein npc2-related [Anaeramoeba flamelloides]|uniref:Niemann pick type c2 protein npc2-related n=1 Tax=Anaeramoeba flamelloides TaxID=1746091 RepID=A0AAV7YN28_9EUKA|nr:niemann pick type c2 protein npc2-related [Anaeramoeba flamelloides]|eukprot:Anaeramoba_flamelloidesc42323_g3_i1.p1 GENE.c42323_g3_i1~~c42323_g3_i1.p1  ORF type:complete len:451 (+),score=62.07 c42323_g3_i1:61-1353(+)